MNNFDLTKYLAEGRLFESFNMDFLTKTYDGDEDLDNDYEDFDNALDGIVSNVPNSIWDGERVRLNSYLINGDESEGLTGWDIIQRMVSDLTYIGWYDDITDYTKENNPNLDDDEIENIGRKLEDDIWDSLKMFAQKYNLSSPKYLAEGKLLKEVGDMSILDKKYNSQEELDMGEDAIAKILDDIIAKFDPETNTPITGQEAVRIVDHFILKNYNKYLESKESVDGWDIIRDAAQGFGLNPYHYYPSPEQVNNGSTTNTFWKEHNPDKTYEEFWYMLKKVGDDAKEAVSKFLINNGKEGVGKYSLPLTKYN